MSLPAGADPTVKGEERTGARECISGMAIGCVAGGGGSWRSSTAYRSEIKGVSVTQTQHLMGHEHYAQQRLRDAPERVILTFLVDVHGKVVERVGWGHSESWARAIFMEG